MHACTGESVKDVVLGLGEEHVGIGVLFGGLLASALSLCCEGLLTTDFPAHREFRHKSNITFNDNDTVSFLEYRSFQFQPDKSHGLESDYIVMPNILVLVRLPAPGRAPGPSPHLCPQGLPSLFSPAPSPCPGWRSVLGLGGVQPVALGSRLAAR